MSSAINNIQVLGIHPVQPSETQFEEAVRIQWGTNLSEMALHSARQNVRKHFEGLYLIEIQMEPPDAKINWIEVTQPMENQPPSNWQCPYDEQPVNKSSGRWAFFMHFVDFKQPLITPCGDRILPNPTPTPPHLATISYKIPG
jgi:hypothetical protein